MTRKIEDEQDKIMNGNRFMNNPNETVGVFHRDVDKLMFQYENLRKSLFTQYKEYLPDPTTQMELRSYIDEQFVRLVKEYEINGPVDFPGYIKTKLSFRVKHSYIKGEYRDRKRVFVTRNEFDISNLMDQAPARDEELDYYEVLEYALSNVKLTELERGVLMYILQEMTDSQVEKAILKNNPKNKYNSQTVRESIKEMQTFLKYKLKHCLEL